MGLADAYASLRLEIASAYTLVFFLMIVPLLLAMQCAVASARGDVPGGRGVSAIPDAAKPIAITLERCAKTFADGTRALEPLDLTIGAGETVVFLGPSGCGKTTTLRIIAGLEAPDPGGRVLFDGTDVTPLRDREAQRRHGVPVLRAVPEHERGGNIGYGLTIRHRPQGGGRRARRRDAGHDAHRGAGGPQHRSALGRPAAAGGAWRARSPCSRAPCCWTSR